MHGESAKFADSLVVKALRVKRLAAASLSEETEKDACRNGGTDDSGNVRSHRVHEQMV